MALPPGHEVRELAESAQQILARMERLKMELEQLRPQFACSAADVEALAIETESLIAKARQIRTDLEDA